MLLFAVGEGVRDRILASNDISLNANLAKYREGIKAGRARKNRNRSSELNGKSGLLLLKQDWNAAQNEAAIAMIKVRLNMIDKLQEKTLYDGQSEYYRNLQ